MLSIHLDPKGLLEHSSTYTPLLESDRASSRLVTKGVRSKSQSSYLIQYCSSWPFPFRYFCLPSNQSFSCFTVISYTLVDSCNLILPSDFDLRLSVAKSIPPYLILFCNLLKRWAIWPMLILKLMAIYIGVLWNLIFSIYADASFPNVLSCMCSLRTDTVSLHYFLTRKGTSVGNPFPWMICLSGSI